ncbi:thioredoxin family protein [Ekhidna sp. To15]|uniref:thioredoxin family protein n=1 Tax=Ekhidna sp. To15 TaxID=3395267 RepID=UPI003F51DACC
MDLKHIIASSLNQSYSAEEYQTILSNFAAEGKTSGEQKEDLIYYTKLNSQRSKRIGKTSVLRPDLVEQIQTLPKQIWLLITETWCGDAANSVPIIAKLAELNPSIDLRIVLRDENLELMDQFLTKGGRSIPKLIALDEELNVLFDWGPRPKEAQSLYWGWREREDREPYKEFQVTLQKWYNENKSGAVQEEIAELLVAKVS